MYYSYDITERSLNISYQKNESEFCKNAFLLESKEYQKNFIISSDKFENLLILEKNKEEYKKDKDYYVKEIDRKFGIRAKKIIKITENRAKLINNIYKFPYYTICFYEQTLSFENQKIYLTKNKEFQEKSQKIELFDEKNSLTKERKYIFQKLNKKDIENTKKILKNLIDKEKENL